jgi:hypothetical protein
VDADARTDVVLTLSLAPLADQLRPHVKILGELALTQASMTRKLLEPGCWRARQDSNL